MEETCPQIFGPDISFVPNTYFQIFYWNLVKCVTIACYKVSKFQDSVCKDFNST